MKNQEKLPTIVEFTFEEAFNCKTALNEKTGEVSICLSDLLKAQGSKTHTSDVVPELKEMFGDGCVIVVPIADALGRIQDTIFIIEPAAMYLVARGRTEVGKRLNKWIFTEVLPQLKKTGSYTIPNSVKEKNLSPMDEEIRAAISIANAFGFTGNQALLSANNLFRNTYGIDVLKEMGQTHLINETQELYFTPTQLGNKIGISARKFNDRLIAAGLAQRSNGKVIPTEKGKPFTQVLDTGKKHSNGVPVQQVKWSDKVSDLIF